MIQTTDFPPPYARRANIGFSFHEVDWNALTVDGLFFAPLLPALGLNELIPIELSGFMGNGSRVVLPVLWP